MSNNLNSVTVSTSKEKSEISHPNDTPLDKVSSLLAAMCSHGAKTASTLKLNLAFELVWQEPASLKEAPGTIARKT
jgi:hypothetical protein